MKRIVFACLAFCALTGLIVAGATASSKQPPRTSASLKLSTKTTMTKGKNGVRHYHFVFGPLNISPGQNSIFLDPNGLGQNARPKENGYILSFTPNLITSDGTVPRVDVTHLHHAVWLVNGSPTWAAGEEKTSVRPPAGYGWAYKTTDDWRMNHMLHNLTPTPDTVYITYDMDFLPASAPQAANITPVHTQWMDVEGGKAYPVFDALRGKGRQTTTGRRFTFPDDDPQAPRINSWTVTKPETIVYTAGHLHPGGLYTDLTVTRNGVTKRIFRSAAKYWEPAGAVSWDVSMTNTPPNWKVSLQPGDVVKVHAAYDTSKASWYEVMGIMPLAVADGDRGVDPFAHKVKTTGPINHGPLAENRHHGGAPTSLYSDPLKLLSGPIMDNKTVTIDDFFYSQGNMLGGGKLSLPPVLHQGQTLTFQNDDSPPGLIGKLSGGSGTKLPIYHTITDCKTPCNKTTGIAYPLANGKSTFDSGELGYGPQGITAAAQTYQWQVPKTLKTGTYAYFCRVHPYMRGSFRVIKP